MKKIVDNPTDVMLWLDLDDTLWDMWGNSVICLRELYDDCRLDRWFESAEEWDRIYHEINHELWSLYSKGGITRDFLREERFARPLRIGGASPEEAAAMWSELDRRYLDSLGRKTALIDGARDLLDYLKRRGYRLGIVSNGFREVQYNKMKSSAIDSYFDLVVLSDDVGVNKPDRRIFEASERIAGSSKMRNMLIGDNLATDIAGAVGAGWEAVWFRRDNSGQAPDGVTTVTTLEQVKELL